MKLSAKLNVSAPKTATSPSCKTLCTSSRTKMLKEKIYYVDEEILKRIESEFELIEKKDWYKLYENKNDKSFWRLDEWDKYQVQIFVKIESLENWAEFDDKD
jgi:hypothetical protein